MSIEKIIAEAIENNPLKLKEAFEEEMNARVRAALEEKYKEMTSPSEVSEEVEAMVEGEDHDEDEGDDEEVAKDMKKMHKDGADKTEVLKAMKEKYGCSGDKAEGLYASNCGG
ncbi:MAG: hypothetical protein ACKVJK_01515 [Methylophagaceae bacterium]|jgi:hypothetical protein|tara:strand:- start:1176 stop:1514 length:339 start_codon:yes stop_codon:yes gene_type:complete